MKRRASWYWTLSGTAQTAQRSVSAPPAAVWLARLRAFGGGDAKQIQIDLAHEQRRQQPERRSPAVVDDERQPVGGLGDRDAVDGERVVLEAAQGLDETRAGRQPGVIPQRRLGEAGAAPQRLPEVPAHQQHAFTGRHAGQIARARASSSVWRRYSGSGMTAASSPRASTNPKPAEFHVRGYAATSPAAANCRTGPGYGADAVPTKARGQVRPGQAAQRHQHCFIGGAIGLDEREPGADRIAPEGARGVDRQLAVAGRYSVNSDALGTPASSGRGGTSMNVSCDADSVSVSGASCRFE